MLYLLIHSYIQVLPISHKHQFVWSELLIQGGQSRDNLTRFIYLLRSIEGVSDNYFLGLV